MDETKKYFTWHKVSDELPEESINIYVSRPNFDNFVMCCWFDKETNTLVPNGPYCQTAEEMLDSCDIEEMRKHEEYDDDIELLDIKDFVAWMPAFIPEPYKED